MPKVDLIETFVKPARLQSLKEVMNSDLAASFRAPAMIEKVELPPPPIKTEDYTSIMQWVTDPVTESRGVALRPAAQGLKCMPLRPGFERVEVMVLEARGHHKHAQIVIWDVPSIPGRMPSKLEGFKK